MSNRTDWKELAEEVLDRSGYVDDPELAKRSLQERLEAEFRNAFVAGQEHENKRLTDGIMQVISDLSYVDEHNEATVVASTTISELQTLLGIA